MTYTRLSPIGRGSNRGTHEADSLITNSREALHHAPSTRHSLSTLLHSTPLFFFAGRLIRVLGVESGVLGAFSLSLSGMIVTVVFSSGFLSVDADLSRRLSWLGAGTGFRRIESAEEPWPGVLGVEGVQRLDMSEGVLRPSSEALPSERVVSGGGVRGGRGASGEPSRELRPSEMGV